MTETQKFTVDAEVTPRTEESDEYWEILRPGQEYEATSVDEDKRFNRITVTVAGYKYSMPRRWLTFAE